MKYILHYCERCTPKLKEFKTKKAYEKFIKEFVPSDDDCLDFVIKGEIELVIDPHYKEFV
jgi:hypothetical protein